MFHADYFVIMRYNLQCRIHFYNLNISCSHRHKYTTSELNCSMKKITVDGDTIFDLSKLSLRSEGTL